MGTTDCQAIRPVDAQTVRSSGYRWVHGLNQLQHAIQGGTCQNQQMDRGELKARLLNIRLGHCTLDSGLYERRVRATGRMAEKCITLGIVGAWPGNGSLSGWQCKRGSAIIWRPGDEMDAVAPAGAHWYAMTIPMDWLMSILDAIPNRAKAAQYLRTGPLPFGLRTNSILRTLAGIERRFEKPGDVTQEEFLEERLVLDYIDAMTPATNPLKDSRGKHLLARQAEAWMHDHLDEPFSMVALCSTLRCSRRYLEYCFRTVFEMGPASYFRLLRLNRAHLLLLAQDADSSSVTTIAMHVGFRHLSRFAQDYRGLFGERPRDTLRRRAGT